MSTPSLPEPVRPLVAAAGDRRIGDQCAAMAGACAQRDDAADRGRNLLLAAQRLFGWRVEAVDDKATARMSIPLYVAAAAGTL
jgi:hypothetical protein